MSNEMMKREMQEAVQAGERALQSLYAARDKLGSARNGLELPVARQMWEEPLLLWDSTYTQKMRKGFILTSLSPLQQIQKSKRAV